MGKIAILDQYLVSLRVVNGSTAKRYAHSCSGPRKSVTPVAGKWRRLLFAETDDGVFMTRSLNVPLKTTEQHLVVHSGKPLVFIGLGCTVWPRA